MSIYGAWRALGSPSADHDARLSRELAGRVWQFARPYRLQIAGLLAAIVVTSVLAAIPPLLFRAIIDDAIMGRRLGLLHLLAVAVLTVTGGGALAQVAARMFSSRIGEQVVFDLRVALFEHVQRQPVAFFARTRTGALTSRLTTDLVGGHRVFTETLSAVAQTILGVVVTLGAMVLLDWRLTLLALAIAPLFVAVARRMRGRLHQLMGAQLTASAELTSQMTERFQVGGALLVKLFGRPDLELRRFQRRAGRLRDIGVETAVLSRVFHVAFALVSGVGIGLVYWVGGWLVITGSVTLGTIVAFTAYLTQLYTPLTMLANARVDLAAALVSFQRVFEVLDFRPMIVERPDATDLPRPRGHIEFEDVWFRHPSAAETTIVSLEGEAIETGYDQDAWVLHDVSFRVEPGQTVALVGPSGAGKTTISMLVPRMYDVTRGAVRIDGHDVRDLTLASLSRTVGVVAQDTHLFHDTVRHNLLYAKPDASERELHEAARAARIHELIASLPDGYDTVVGERGYRFSGGEKQRLAIARLLLRDPAIVLLDEATAHLDSESEVLIRRALAEALSGRSSVVIAHRLSTIVDADLILVLDRGRIIERGTHEQLLAGGGLYRQLHRMQFDRSAVG